ncbi:UNVERIFIED_CONTAM: hypothetical protein GTU68_000728 [Idotea baltica]|nr:hypothetical protein [Idotea baltica]
MNNVKNQGILWNTSEGIWEAQATWMQTSSKNNMMKQSQRTKNSKNKLTKRKHKYNLFYIDSKN